MCLPPPLQNSKPWGVANACSEYCAANDNTSYYMGPIHPRAKHLVGRRMALAAATTAYPADTPKALSSQGPTLRNCSVGQRKP